MAAIPIGQTATSAAENVWTINEGPQVEAFQNWWNDEDGLTKRLTEDGIGAMLIGAALILFAAITLAMKIAWIIALIILAAQVAIAIVASFATFGAASASIPGFIAVCRHVCMRLLRKVIKRPSKNSSRSTETPQKGIPKENCSQDTQGEPGNSAGREATDLALRERGRKWLVRA